MSPYRWTPENAADVAAFLAALTAAPNSNAPSPAVYLNVQAELITAPDLAAVRFALRLDAQDAGTIGALTRIVNALTALANRQAPGAPVDVAHEAIIRATGTLYDGTETEADYPSVWRRSGAAALLKPWTVRRAGIVEAAD